MAARAEWNAIFSGTRQEVRDLMFNPTDYQNLIQAKNSGYTIGDLRTAFEKARDDSFAWLFHAAIRPNNLQQLLVKSDQANKGYNPRTPQIYTEDNI